MLDLPAAAFLPQESLSVALSLLWTFRFTFSPLPKGLFAEKCRKPGKTTVNKGGFALRESETPSPKGPAVMNFGSDMNFLKSTHNRNTVSKKKYVRETVDQTPVGSPTVHYYTVNTSSHLQRALQSANSEESSPCEASTSFDIHKRVRADK